MYSYVFRDFDLDPWRRNNIGDANQQTFLPHALAEQSAVAMFMDVDAFSSIYFCIISKCQKISMTLCFLTALF